MSMRATKRSTAVLIAAAAAALAGTSIGTAADSSDVASSPQAENQIAAMARRDVAQLRRTRSLEDVLPPVLAESPLTADAGVGSSRRIPLSGVRAGWLMAGSAPGQLCFVVLGAATCDDASVLHANGLLWSLNWRPNEPTRLEGVAADGITTVTAQYGDGTTDTVDVAGNGFTFTVPEGKHAVGLTWSGSRGSGDVRLTLPDPH